MSRNSWRLTDVDARQFKQRLAEVFDRVAQGYDRAALRLYPFAADRLVYELPIAPGEKVLDVATGTGAAALAAARLTGPRGRVMGIDISEAMLDRAHGQAERQGYGHVDLHAMDAEQLEFRGGYFDAVVCTAALHLLPDMLKGLREARRVLKPGGRLALTGFGRQAYQPMAGRLLEVLEASGARLPDWPVPRLWQRLESPEEYSELLAAAGFTDIHISTHQLGYHLAGANDWWEVVWYSELRDLVERLPSEALGAFRVAHQEGVEGLRSDRGIWLDVETVFASGLKPAE